MSRGKKENIEQGYAGAKGEPRIPRGNQVQISILEKVAQAARIKFATGLTPSGRNSLCGGES